MDRYRGRDVEERDGGRVRDQHHYDGGGRLGRRGEREWERERERDRDRDQNQDHHYDRPQDDNHGRSSSSRAHPPAYGTAYSDKDAITGSGNGKDGRRSKRDRRERPPPPSYGGAYTDRDEDSRRSRRDSRDRVSSRGWENSRDTAGRGQR